MWVAAKDRRTKLVISKFAALLQMHFLPSYENILYYLPNRARYPNGVL